MMNDSPVTRLKAEVAIVGSGPGGSVTACTLAEAGRDVLLIEEGPDLPADTPEPFSQAEMVEKYRNGGVTVALGPAKVAYVEGRCVGGGSEVNSGLYHRTPPEVLERWRHEFRADALGERDLRPHFEQIERDLSVSLMPPGAAPAASLRLEAGARALGWSAREVPRWYRYDGPHGGGERQSMSRTYVPRAVAAGARLVAGAGVRSLRRDGSKWALRAAGAAGRFEVSAENVFICGGAVQTPALLRRGGFRRNVGESLGLHPTVKAVARFDREVNAAGVGVPVHQVKDLAPRFSFGCSISTPPYLALAAYDHPETLAELSRDWPFLAVYYAMVPGAGTGKVRALPGLRDPLVVYRAGPHELTDLGLALRHLCRLLLAAGAVAVYPCASGAGVVRGEGDVERLPVPLPARRSNLMTIHLSSSCPLGGDPRRCATDSFGRVRGAEGLYVADASLLCTPPTVNPQGTIMAVARRNAMRFLGEL
jgi:choline dehydrogenase-like flavoprotein